MCALGQTGLSSISPDRSAPLSVEAASTGLGAEPNPIQSRSTDKDGAHNCPKMTAGARQHKGMPDRVMIGQCAPQMKDDPDRIEYAAQSKQDERQERHCPR